MEKQIKEIPYYDTWQIRHQVMWPNEPIDSVKLTNDKEGKHFGFFIHAELVSVVSLFVNDDAAQFRKFATIQEEQGKGYGSALLQFVFSLVREAPIPMLWCNARINKTRFYEGFGMETTDKRFLKGGIEYVIMEKKLKSS